MKKKTLFCILSVSLLCSLSHANLVMKITADDTVLTVGQTTTLRVYGLAEEAVAGNGLYDWGVSAVVDVSGVVQANNIYNVIEPSPVDSGSIIMSRNLGSSGNIDASAAIQFTASASEAGVGGYSELFNIEIEAIGYGDVQYSLSNILGDLFDLVTMYDTGSGNVTIDEANSVGQISVVPEPTSLLILSGLSAMGYFSRKRG